VSAPRGLFVTGTDTEVGKTWVSVALIAALRARGLSVAAMKPIASGGERDAAGRLVNEDALALQAAIGGTLDYAQINPYVFEPPIAPHLAAAEAGVALSLERLAAQAQDLAAGADIVVVEGVGGWAVPLDERHSVADLARALGWPVVLVVGLRLGCLNHALLTAQAIEAAGLSLAGWVANAIDPGFERVEANLGTLRARLAAPLLGHLPHAPGAAPGELGAYLQLDALPI